MNPVDRSPLLADLDGRPADRGSGWVLYNYANTAVLSDGYFT